MRPKFIVDANVGRLAKRIRMLGYDTAFVNDIEDGELVRTALRENRIILTKDTGILKRRVVSSGRVKAIFIESPDVRDQIDQVVRELNLAEDAQPFSLCMECNSPLSPKGKEEICSMVPPYVLQNQHEYTQCPVCRRVYWRGTHWQKMSEELQNLNRL